MNDVSRNSVYFAIVAFLFIGTGMLQSWDSALQILNFALISAIMALGVNLQWGFAGLFNVGIMGFVALGGLATVLVAMPPEPEAWAAGGARVLLALILGAATVVATILAYAKLPKGRVRALSVLAILIVGFFVYRAVFDGGVAAIEAINPARAGNIGGLNPGGKAWGWMTIVAWPFGGLLAAGVAWIIGKTALGLRSDYLAIATLGIAEIIIAVMKNEDWLSRGVKNITGLPRPTPYEIDLQNSAAFVERVSDLGFTIKLGFGIEFKLNLGIDPVTASTLSVKLIYAGLFSVVLILLFLLAQRALHSPWGRMMRAIRDNEVASQAMGKDITARHLQVFILGSAICGIAGAMMTTLDGQLTPGAYQPLRFTFLVWVMVIVGGSGSNLGSVLGGFLIWWLWVMVEPLGLGLMNLITAGMPEGYWLRTHLIDSAAHMRLLTMGLVLLLVLRFSPRGLIPEK